MSNYLDDRIDYLVALAMRSRKFFRAYMADTDISMPQYIALQVIQAAPGIRMKELARRLETSTPAATVMIDKLITHGMVERLPNPTDRRTVQLRITDNGRHELQKQDEYMREHMKRLFGKLSDAELEQYIALHEKLLS